MSARQKRILVFDDDPDILTICSIILKGKGFDVHTFENANNIIEKVDLLHPDLVLMDNWIPDIGGVEAIQLLKNSEAFNKIPVIFFTANQDIQQLAEKAGADSFIAKPFDIAKLEKLIEDLL